MFSKLLFVPGNQHYGTGQTDDFLFWYVRREQRKAVKSARPFLFVVVCFVVVVSTTGYFRVGSGVGVAAGPC